MIQNLGIKLDSLAELCNTLINMWIQYKYNDHGWSNDYKPLEIPDDLSGRESVIEYLCDCTDIFPVWSERFCTTRIKYQEIKPTKEMILEKISILEFGIKHRLAEIEKCKALL